MEKKRFSSKIRGFTLIELMIVIAIISILAAIAIPNFLRSRQKAKMISLVADLKSFEKGFNAYAAQYGVFPNDSEVVIPPEANSGNFLPINHWNKPLYVGGNYDWEGPDTHSYSGIALSNTTAPSTEIVIIDQYIDDGNLQTGKFRLTSNGRYTYIIDE